MNKIKKLYRKLFRKCIMCNTNLLYNDKLGIYQCPKCTHNINW